MTPTQCRMARAALGWTTRQVAVAANVSAGAAAALQAGNDVSSRVAAQVRSALECEGIVFTPDEGHGPGVCFKETEKPRPAGVLPKPSGPATHGSRDRG